VVQGTVAEVLVVAAFGLQTLEYVLMVLCVTGECKRTTARTDHHSCIRPGNRGNHMTFTPHHNADAQPRTTATGAPEAPSSSHCTTTLPPKTTRSLPEHQTQRARASPRNTPHTDTGRHREGAGAQSLKIRRNGVHEQRHDRTRLHSASSTCNVVTSFPACT
jgi:hypothetical protein